MAYGKHDEDMTLIIPSFHEGYTFFCTTVSLIKYALKRLMKVPNDLFFSILELLTGTLNLAVLDRRDAEYYKEYNIHC